HEHLDYHGSYENYRAAKSRLFLSLAETMPKDFGNSRLSIFNMDDRSFPYLDSLQTNNKIRYGLSSSADLRAEDISQTRNGINIRIIGENINIPVSAKLYGRYNVYNCLAALSAAIFGLGIDPSVCTQGLAEFEGVTGRMQSVDLGQNFSAFVDFAHTPNALKVTLQTAREMVPGNAGKNSQYSRVIAVFGSAGLRDKEKRRMMAEISAELADITILTAEDPRTESLGDILEEMAEGAVSKGGVENVSFFRVPDRGDAIRLAVKMANPGDIVLACGKGHEQSMCFGTTEYHWDDSDAMKIALSELLGIAAEKMHYLPTSEK
ncbi:MAG: cyanophycin synthetase, partial [Chloroflexota bacterium]